MCKHTVYSLVAGKSEQQNYRFILCSRSRIDWVFSTGRAADISLCPPTPLLAGLSTGTNEHTAFFFFVSVTKSLPEKRDAFIWNNEDF